jgi:hypothetical protein
MKNTFDSLKKLGATIYIASAGGGSLAVSDLAAAPGRSSVILGSTFLNSMDLFNKFIGVTEWKKYASMESAERLAVKAQEIGGYGRYHVGVGIACSLATYNEREGRSNLCNICIVGYNFRITRAVPLDRIFNMSDEQRRLYQEKLVADDAKYLIAVATEILLSEYKSSKYCTPIILNEPSITSSVINVYPGSFNPIHEGHKFLKENSERITGAKSYYELSLLNWEKPQTSIEEAKKRVDLIGEPIILTYCKTFVEKYKWLKATYPQLTAINFIVGLDTWDRLSNEDLVFFQEAKDVKFLVYGRNGEWIDQIEYYTWKHIIWTDVDGSMRSYNNPISSRQLR